jgi:hypothetical protein
MWIFSYFLFSGAISISDHIVSSDRMGDAVEGVWRETVLVY